MPAAPISSFPPVTTKFPGLSLLPGLDIKVVWRPRAYNYPPQTAASGREVIAGAAANPSHEFDLIYNVLRNRILTEVEFQTLMGFWLQQNGTEFPFLFSNPYDNTVSANAIGATSSSTQYLLTRTFGANGYGGTEPVGTLDYTANFNLYIDGTLKPSSDPTYGYTVNLATPWHNLLVFNSTPPAGHSITVDMSYFYFCRLSEDSTDFETVLFNVWQNPKLTLVSKKGF
jgi:hypothetical protein